jgi:hypothetical protein
VNFATALTRLREGLAAEARRLDTDQQRSELTRTSATLQERLDSLKRSMARLLALRDNGFAVAEAAVPVGEVRDAWQALQRGSKGDVEKLSALAGERWAALKQAERRLEDAVAAAYRDARRHLLPPALQRFYARLARSGALQEAHARVVELDGQILRQLSEKVPARLDEALRLAKELRASRDSTRAALAGEVPEAVEQLLSKAEADQATLADVTPEALTWLRDHQADAEVRLSLANVEDRR